MMKALLIAGGGAAGSVARYGIQQLFAATFPVGTLVINLLGCFLIGLLWACFSEPGNEAAQLLLITGFCGGFTTFSAFSMESIQLMAANRWADFVLYFAGSIAGGLLATYLGFKTVSS